MEHTECILGFPGTDLQRIVAEMEELAARGMARVRETPVFRSLMQRTDRPQEG